MGTEESVAKNLVVLLQFAKEPVPGRVKTRMQPQLSSQAACALHVDLVRWTSKTLCDSGLGDVELWFSGARQHPVFDDCEVMGVKQLCAQQGRDLGERMHHAITDGLERYGKVVLVGSDCPAIDRAYLVSALDSLNRADLVLGPAHDGGYVLIGASRINRELFEGVKWGGAQVLQQTLDRALKLGLSSELLAPLSDIDRPDDLPHWQSLQTGA